MDRFVRVPFFCFWSRCCCCYCLLLLLPTTSVLKRREVLARSEGLARVRVRARRGGRAALARWQGGVSAVSHTRPNHRTLELFSCDFTATRPRFIARLARSDSPQSRGPCPSAHPPSPRASRTRVSHMRRTSSHEPRYQCTAICYCCWASCRTASLKQLNNIIQLPLHVPSIVSNNYFVYCSW